MHVRKSGSLQFVLKLLDMNCVMINYLLDVRNLNCMNLCVVSCSLFSHHASCISCIFALEFLLSINYYY